jgi:hypothetical protein
MGEGREAHLAMQKLLGSCVVASHGRGKGGPPGGVETPGIADHGIARVKRTDAATDCCTKRWSFFLFSCRIAVPRKCNSSAHELAKLGLSMEAGQSWSWMDGLPADVMVKVARDLAESRASNTRL